MKTTSELICECIRAHWRSLELGAWCVWGVWLVTTWFAPIQAETRWRLLWCLVATGAYLGLLFHFPLRRFHAQRWFLHWQLAIGAVVALAVGLTLKFFIPFDVILALYVVLVSLLANRRVGVGVALGGSLLATLFDPIAEGIILRGFVLLLRALTYSALLFLFWTMSHHLSRQWAALLSEAQRQANEAAQRLRELQAVQALAKAIGASLDLEVVLQLAIAQSIETLKMEAGFIALLNVGANELRVVAQHGFAEPLAEQIRATLVPAHLGLAGLALAERRPIVSTDLANDPRVIRRGIVSAGYKTYLCIPLIVGEQAVGVLSVTSFRSYQPNPTELIFLEAIGEQTALAIHRARLYAQEQTRRQLAEALGRITQVVGDRTELDEVLLVILDELQRLVPYQSAAVLLESQGRLRVRAGRGHPPHIDLNALSFDVKEDVLVDEMLHTGKVVSVPDTHRDPQWVAHEGLTYIRCWAGAPLFSHGQFVGILTLDRVEPFAMRADEIALLEIFAPQVALALEKARLMRQAQRRLDRLSVVNQISQAINSALELPQVLQLVYEQVGQLMGNRDFYIALYDETTDEVSVLYNYAHGQVKHVASRRGGNGLAEYVIRTRQPLLIENDTTRFAEAHGLAVMDEPSLSWLGAPLLKGERVIGVMAVQNYTRAYAYDEEDRELFQTLAGQVAIALDNARLYDATRRSLQEAEALYAFNHTLKASAERPTIVIAAATACCALMPAHWGAFYLYEGEPPQLTLFAVIEAQRVRAPALFETSAQSADASLRQMLIQQVVTQRQAIRWDDVRPLAHDAASIEMRSALGVPILSYERMLGLVQLTCVTLRAYSERDEQFVKTLASQLAVALESVRLRELEAQRTFELSGLHEIAQTFANLDDPLPAYTAVARRLTQIFKASAVLLCRYEREHDMLRALPPAYAVPDIPLRYSLRDDEGVLSWNPYTTTFWTVNDLASLPERARVFAHELDAQRILAASLLGREGLIGVVFLGRSAAQASFTARDGELLSTFARQIALALENVQLIENERFNRQKLMILHQIGQRAAQSLELEVLLQELVEYIRSRLRLHTVALFLLDGEVAVLHAVVGGFATGSPIGYRQPLTQGMIGRAARTGEPCVINRLGDDPDFIDPFALGIRSEADIPLTLRGAVMGVLSAASNVPNQFGRDDVELLRMVAGQVAQAIVNARLYESERQSHAQLALINHVARRLLSITSLSALMQEIAVAVEQGAHYPIVNTFLLEGEELVLKGSAGEFKRAMPSDYRQSIHEGSFGFAVRSGQTYVVHDVNHDPYYVEKLTSKLQSEVAVPLKIEGQVIGLLIVAARLTYAFSANDVKTLETVADQAAQAIANVRLYEAEQRRVNQLATISKLGREITSLHNYKELYQRSVELLKQSFGYEAVHLFVADSATGLARLMAGVTPQGIAPHLEQVTLRIGKDGLVGKAIGACAVILENNVKQNPDYIEPPDYHATRSELVVPIQLGERVLGAFDAQSNQLNAFGPEDVFVMRMLADQFAVAMSNAELHATVEHQAQTDPLTEVYNHGYFLQRLQAALIQCEREGRELSLIMLDVDHFKKYNDTYGHLLGDIVLRNTAQVIRRHIKSDDLVGRWGGEEFGVALLRTGPREALLVAERIRQTLATTLLKDDSGQIIPQPTVSQGIALFPRHALEAFALIDQADKMLYVAKNRGRDQVVMVGEAEKGK